MHGCQWQRHGGCRQRHQHLDHLFKRTSCGFGRHDGRSVHSNTANSCVGCGRNRAHVHDHTWQRHPAASCIWLWWQSWRQRVHDSANYGKLHHYRQCAIDSGPSCADGRSPTVGAARRRARARRVDTAAQPDIEPLTSCDIAARRQLSRAPVYCSPGRFGTRGDGVAWNRALFGMSLPRRAKPPRGGSGLAVNRQRSSTRGDARRRARPR